MVAEINVNEFGEVLDYAFKIITDLIRSKVFLTLVEYFLK